MKISGRKADNQPLTSRVELDSTTLVSKNIPIQVSVSLMDTAIIYI